VSAQAITASDLDLLSFFEVEPKPRDSDIPWPYNDFLYETTRGEFQISFAVAPAYRDVHFVLALNGRTLYELTAVGVDDVRYEKDGSGELLEVMVSSSESLTLRLRPEVSIDHHVAGRISPNT